MIRRRKPYFKTVLYTAKVKVRSCIFVSFKVVLKGRSQCHSGGVVRSRNSGTWPISQGAMEKMA